MTTTKKELWNRMLRVVKPSVTVSRATTRPRATTKPPPTDDRVPADPRFDRSNE